MAQAFASFFAIIDPLGNILVFYLFTQHFAFRQKLLAASVAVAASFLMLLAFALAGHDVLDFLSISPESFEVAAGLLLLPPAYRLVTEGQPAREDEREASGPLDFALVPLATPLIAGPGALAATTSFSEQVGRGETLGAIALVLAITLVAFVAADQIFRLLGAALLRLMSRIIGIVLFAIAVDFVLDGLGTFIDAHNLALLPFFR
jgi:multiple antibiotic resistance protein